MNENSEPQPRLPAGTTVLKRAQPVDSPDLADELAELGGSETLVDAVRGDREGERAGAAGDERDLRSADA